MERQIDRQDRDTQKGERMERQKDKQIDRQRHFTDDV